MANYIRDEKGRVLVYSYDNTIFTDAKRVSFFENLPSNYEVAAHIYYDKFGEILSEEEWEKALHHGDSVYVEPNREFFVHLEHDGEPYVLYLDEIKTHTVKL